MFLYPADDVQEIDNYATSSTTGFNDSDGMWGSVPVFHKLCCFVTSMQLMSCVSLEGLETSCKAD